jgi:O-methyltransferase
MRETVKNYLLRSFMKLPVLIQSMIYHLRYVILNPRLLPAFRDFRHSDEKLKFIHILEAMNYLRVAGVNGDVLPQTFFEFGCHSGRTFSAAVNAARFLRMRDVDFFAFDSFEGLPQTNEIEDGYFQTGTFFTSKDDFWRIVKRRTGVRLADRQIIKGFYNESLKEVVRNRMPKAGVIHIDVDLYSSTVDVLDFIAPLLVEGSVILFDDWHTFPGGSLMGERRAMAEFMLENPDFRFEPWKTYSTFGQSFFVTKVAQSNSR